VEVALSKAIYHAGNCSIIVVSFEEGKGKIPLNNPFNTHSHLLRFNHLSLIHSTAQLSFKLAGLPSLVIFYLAFVHENRFAR